MTLRIVHAGRAALAAACLLAPVLTAAPPALAQTSLAPGAPGQPDGARFVRLSGAPLLMGEGKVLAPRPEPPPPPRNPLDFFFRWLLERWRRMFG